MTTKNFINLFDSNTKWYIKRENVLYWWGQGQRYSAPENYLIKSIQWTKKGIVIFI